MFRPLTVNDMEMVAHRLAQELMTWDEPIPPFATRYPQKLESCLNTISQSFGGQDLYPTLTHKTAALFYFLIKDHPFQNGNKRVAVTTLLVLLKRNDYWLEVDPTRLYNFAVWVAQSDRELHAETISATEAFIRKNLKNELSEP